MRIPVQDSLWPAFCPLRTINTLNLNMHNCMECHSQFFLYLPTITADLPLNLLVLSKKYNYTDITDWRWFQRSPTPSGLLNQLYLDNA